MSVKRAAFGAVIATILALAQSAHADEVDACVAGADKAQQLRDQAKLVEAREQLIACAAANCPTAVAKQCAKWLGEVDEAIPSIALRVRSSSGSDVADAEVTLDGAVRPGALDGKPIKLDPGAHKFTFKRGDEMAESTIVVREGEKNRPVDVTLVAPAVAIVTPPPPPLVAPEEPRAGFRFPWTAGVFIGVAVASFAGTAALVAVASSDAGDLRSTCAPACSVSDVDAAHTKLVVANVTLGVGIGSLALAAIFLVAANVGHHADHHSAKRTALFTF
jgi:hypothetical protein